MQISLLRLSDRYPFESDPLSNATCSAQCFIREAQVPANANGLSRRLAWAIFHGGPNESAHGLLL
jgi:hypothetical protein